MPDGGPLEVMIVAGTRPEAVKLAPVIRAVQRDPGLRADVVSTGQHREMLAQILEPFGIRARADLGVMREGQGPDDVLAATVLGLAPLLREHRPDLLVVQGDTTSALAGALAAFHARVPVGHVEAGLRTHQRHLPFPEEANRRLISVVADLHWAPTSGSAANLLREGVEAGRVVVTGNTVIDCLAEALRLGRQTLGQHVALDRLAGRRVILVTAHRRESWREGIGEVCEALDDVARERPDVAVLFPVHLNPIVRRTVFARLAGRANVHLVDPLPYWAFVEAMARAWVVVTDSGGIQEEAPWLGKPVLVTRASTERPEAIAAGVARIVGTDRGDVRRALDTLLDDPVAYARMAHRASPYGDGRAAGRIVQSIRHFFGRGEAPQPFVATPARPLHEEVTDHAPSTAAA
jgi:UDP-N-acetylglucosamine 2-epimerase (non-hydrolysing)